MACKYFAAPMDIVFPLTITLANRGKEPQFLAPKHRLALPQPWNCSRMNRMVLKALSRRTSRDKTPKISFETKKKRRGMKHCPAPGLAPRTARSAETESASVLCLPLFRNRDDRARPVVGRVGVGGVGYRGAVFDPSVRRRSYGEGKSDGNASSSRNG
jgi:hypothetical protein